MVKRTWQPASFLLALAVTLATLSSAHGQFPSIGVTPTGRPAAKAVPPQPPAPPHPAVVRVIVPDNNSTISYGSGTLVDVRGDYGLVVTNWHVVRDGTGQIMVHFPDGFQCAARVLKTDKDWDLAALAVWRPNAQPVPLAAVSPRPGDVLTIAGYGPGTYRASTGRCTGFGAPRTNLPMELVEVSTEARLGDSGGPIFNTQGELAGVLFGASSGSTVGSYSDRVRQFLLPLAPDLGQDTSAIARSAPARSHEPPPAVASLPVRPRLPKSNKPPPARPQIAASPPIEDPPKLPAIASRTEKLMPVTPLEREGPPPMTKPKPATEHVAAEFGASAGADLIPEPTPAKNTVPLEANVDVSRPAPGLTWQAIAGDTLWMQAKTVLAAVGVLALLFHGSRLMGKPASPAEPAVE